MSRNVKERGLYAFVCFFGIGEMGFGICGGSCFFRRWVEKEVEVFVISGIEWGKVFFVLVGFWIVVLL